MTDSSEDKCRRFEKWQRAEFGGTAGLIVHRHGRTLVVDYQENLHPWLGPDGIQSYAQLLRGEIELPHDPTACAGCYSAYKIQLEMVGWLPGLYSCHPNQVLVPTDRVVIASPKWKRKKVSAKLRELASSGRTETA